ncbi:hypothetical protein EUX98_g1355 [Antrodiella citrinella]|uniref:VWFA domain-containing protein n=1 Tax=Antrodiella citrinella TaxID=2447956 RepID=A0A4S4NA85_9APHY|nr:hypothetical protein EUX98_g1355 [Antrodiella citrinella]
MASPSTPTHGIVHTDVDGHLVNIPLMSVVVQALVIDVSARVTLTQLFDNSSDDSSPRAKYVFPLPASAAIRAFEMICDGRIIYGVAKERQQAEQDHQQALTDGKMTSLVEWATDDLFTISIGPIPGNAMVTTVLTYTLNLMTGDYTDGVRFQLPMSIGQRYGRMPEGMVNASTVSTKTRVSIKVNIQMQGDIKDITSPTHSALTVKPYRYRDSISRRRATAEFSSTEYLTQDFVLCVSAEGLDEPRSFVERDPKDPQSVAMQLTMVPKYDRPRIQEQEFIFILDRSGSMSGDPATSRIGIAKRTLTILLHSLPQDGTIFNVIAFDDTVEAVYPRSQRYDQTSLRHVADRVEGIQTRGGTRIREALEYAVRSRRRSVPTVMFVLTDGEVFEDLDESIQIVSSAVKQASDTASLRIFTLGIGETASSAACENIARAGNGDCLMAPNAHAILPKCMKMMRAGRTGVLQKVSIDWGVPQDLIVDSATMQGSSVRFSGHAAPLRQTPSVIKSISPGYRFVVFAMIKVDNFVAPKFITLEAERDADADQVEIEIPVEEVRFTSDEPRIPLIHTLAARRLITEIQDSLDIPEPDKKASIVQLGERYQLASRYTSFVAVECEQQELALDTRRRSSSFTRFPRRRRAGRQEIGLMRANAEAAALGIGSFVMSAVDYTATFLTVFTEYLTEPYKNLLFKAPLRDADPRFPGAYPSDTSDSDRDDDPGYGSDRTFTTISTLESYSDSDSGDEDARSRRRRRTGDDQRPRSPSPQIHHTPSSGGGDGQQAGNASTSLSQPVYQSPPSEIPQAVYDLVKLSSFDGSFSLNSMLGLIVGQAALQPTSRPAQVDPPVWATVLAVAYYQKHLASHPELLDILLEKAMEYLERVGGSAGLDFIALVDQAKTLVD